MKFKVFTLGNIKVIAKNSIDAKSIQGKMKPLIESSSSRPQNFYWFCFFYIEGIHAEPIEKEFYNKSISIMGEKETINKLILALDTYFLVLKEPVKSVMLVDGDGMCDPLFVAQENKKPSHWSVVELNSVKYIIKTKALPLKNTTLRHSVYSECPDIVCYEIN